MKKLILLIVAAIAAASYLVYAYMNGDPMFGTLAKTMDDLPRNERLGSKRNIVVLGVDGREKDDDPGRSDTLFVVMFDPKSKNVSLLSIPRDTRVRIPGHGWDKINHAYAFGGHKLTQQTTEELLGIQVNNYVMVDFSGFESLVDAIGGIAFAIYSYIIARNSPSYASMATLIDIAMVGMCVGFLMHNWHPAKLFMGDSGSMLLGYLITCASIVMTGRLDPASIHASIYLPVFMPILLPILVLFLPILDMCLAIVRRLRKGQSPMHPDRMHLHHRMLRIGHSVQGAVLILWGWAALIAFGSIMTLFFKAQYVLVGFLIAAVVLTVATMYPYVKHRIPEMLEEDAADGGRHASVRSSKRRKN